MTVFDRYGFHIVGFFSKVTYHCLDTSASIKNSSEKLVYWEIAFNF